MKRIAILSSAFLSLGLALVACNDGSSDTDGMGGDGSGGKAPSSGGKSSSSGGNDASGGRASGGARAGGGPSTDGGSSSGGMNMAGGGMGPGGFGGDMGGAPGIEEACAASCAVTVTIGCPENEDQDACVSLCQAGVAAGCEAEYIANKLCEGSDSADGFQCVEYGPYHFVAASDDSICKTKFDDYFDCATN